MPIVEIDEGELRNLRDLRVVVEKMTKDQEAALLLEQAHKKVNPEAKTPRNDALKASTAPVEELKKQVADLQKKIDDDKAEAAKNANLRALQEKVDAGHAKLLQDGWTADGIKLLDEFREKEGILDPIHAAAVYERLHGPQVTPAVPSSGIGRWDFQDVPEGQEGYAKRLLDTRGDNETLVMQEAMKALTEFRGPNRR